MQRERNGVAEMRAAWKTMLERTEIDSARSHDDTPSLQLHASGSAQSSLFAATAAALHEMHSLGQDGMQGADSAPQASYVT